MQQNPATVLSQDQTDEQGQFMIYILLHITDHFKIHKISTYCLISAISDILVYEFGQLYLYLTQK